jgi:hypothetical protein
MERSEKINGEYVDAHFVPVRLIDEPRRRGNPQERNDATKGYSVH